jgi:hypothetical protein
MQIILYQNTVSFMSTAIPWKQLINSICTPPPSHSSSGFRAIILAWFRDRYSLLSSHLFYNSRKFLVLYTGMKQSKACHLFHAVSCLAYALTVKMKETHYFQWTTLHYIPEFCITTVRISNPIICKSRYIFSLNTYPPFPIAIQCLVWL